MDNRVLEWMLLLLLTVIIIAMVFVISMLIKYEIPVKTCILIYKRFKQKRSGQNKRQMSIKKIVSKKIVEMKKDMQSWKAVQKKNENLVLPEKVKIIANEESVLLPTNNGKKRYVCSSKKFEYIIDKIYTDTEEEII